MARHSWALGFGAPVCRSVIPLVSALLCLVTMAPKAHAQIPAGTEFRIGASGTGHFSDVTMDDVGNFMVVWHEVSPTDLIRARRYDAAGTPLGSALTVTLPGQTGFPAIASESAGKFIVVWHETNGSGLDAFGRRYDAAGAPQGGPFRINTFTTNAQMIPDVASNGSKFVVVWTSLGQDGSGYGVFGQLFNPQGNPSGGEFLVNTNTPGRQGYGVVTASANGFVVVWDSIGQDASGTYGIFGQRFDAAGSRLGTEFLVNTTTLDNQLRPSVASDAAGNFVVVWTQGLVAGDIFGQRFNAAGARIGTEFRLNSYTTGHQYDPAITSDRAGNFVVVWGSNGQDGAPGYGGVFGQRFDSSGLPRGGEFRANTWTTGDQRRPSVAADGAGNFVATWESDNPVSPFEIFGQRFGGLVTSLTEVDAAGNRVFEPGEAVVTAPSWRNVNGAAQTFSGTASNLTGPGAPNNPPYAIVDATADYGTVPNLATGSCTATGNCYTFSIGTPTARPVLHWDATFREDITPVIQGQSPVRTLHVGDSFGDVPRTSGFYRFVETILHHNLTGGCGGGNFCPLQATPREQMAVFVLVAREGAGYQPPACIAGSEMFADVPASSPFCRWIEELARRNIAGGCGGGNFCPLASVSREQMAVFALATKEPAGYSPVACVAGAERFADVPASSPFCKWIEELARRNIAGGCGGGNFCPIAQVTREQNAVFISGTFALALY